MDTRTLTLLRSGFTSSTTPCRSVNGPSVTRTASPFVNAEAVYDPALRTLSMDRALAMDLPVIEGVYAAMRGPAFETPAEVEMLAQMGASVVGMSVVPESLPAHALGLQVLGICSLTNAFGDHVTHEDVLRVSNTTAVAIGRLLVDLLPRLPSEGA